ncbi:hypothetical protein AHiyo1_52720, partial [Arthrobacter sp. Hiyo1]
MQGGHLHSGSGHFDRFHYPVGSDAAGAADVDLDVQQLGVDFLRRVFVGNGPSRHARGVTEGTLRGEVVDFDHDAVDLVQEVVPVFAEVLDEVEDLLEGVQDLQVGADRQAPFLQQLVRFRLARGVEAFACPDAVDEHPQRTLGGFRGVFLAQGAGRGVAGVGQRRLAGLDQRFVEFGECLGRNEDFAPDFHLGRISAAAELARDLLDGEHVVGDVLARGAVSARGGTDQLAIAVQQVHCQAVDLQLRQPRNAGSRRAQLFDRSLGLADPRFQLVEREDVLQAVHPLEVLDGGESSRHLAAYFLCGRIVGHELGMQGLELLEAAVQGVELGIRNRRRIFLVVRVAVLADEVCEVFVLFPYGFRWNCGFALCCAHVPILPQSRDKIRPPDGKQGSQAGITSGYQCVKRWRLHKAKAMPPAATKSTPPMIAITANMSEPGPLVPLTEAACVALSPSWMGVFQLDDADGEALAVGLFDGVAGLEA